MLVRSLPCPIRHRASAGSPASRSESQTRGSPEASMSLPDTLPTTLVGTIHSHAKLIINLGAFIGLIFISAAAGFSPPDYKIPSYKQSDKALHFIAFLLLTLCFYWILETSRRKVLQLTFTVCTIGLGVASEVVQGLLPVSHPPYL